MPDEKNDDEDNVQQDGSGMKDVIQTLRATKKEMNIQHPPPPNLSESRVNSLSFLV
jgi:hypothetical protein